MSASAINPTSGSVNVVTHDTDSSESVNAVSRYKQSKGKKGQVHTPIESGFCRGCGRAEHPEGRRTSCPAFKSICSNCGKVGHYRKVCLQSAKAGSPSPSHSKKPPQTNSLCLPDSRQVGAPRIRLSSVKGLNYADPAPTLTVHVRALNGQASVEVLPDSGADISAAGVNFLAHFNEHVPNLLPSDVKPRAVNGNVLSPIGSLMATVSIGSRSVEDQFHIYGSITGALLSWKTAKALGILPPRYPEPLPEVLESSSVKAIHGPSSRILVHTHQVTKEDLINEFPTVFDGQIRTMPGEVFKIVLTEGAKPFCISTPRTIPYA